eukprot:56439_1
MNYVIHFNTIFNLVFNPDYDNKRLKKIFQLLFEQAQQIMITDNDFTNKAELYKDFLDNKTNGNNVLLFSTNTINKYLSEMDKNIPEYTKILFYFYLKMQHTQKSFNCEFNHLLKEISEGIYEVNTNNFVIDINALKQLFFLKKIKVDQAFKILYQNSIKYMKQEFKEKHFKNITDNSTDPFLNRIKFWQKKQFCEDIRMNSLIPNICQKIKHYQIIESKHLSINQLYCVYLLCKYPLKTNVKQIMLLCFEDEPQLIDDVKLNKKEQEIDSKHIIDFIWTNPTKTLKTVVSNLFDRLETDDMIKLILAQNVFDNMKNNIINSNAICHSLKLLESKLKIPNAIYKNSFC